MLSACLLKYHFCYGVLQYNYMNKTYVNMVLNRPALYILSKAKYEDRMTIHNTCIFICLQNCRKLPILVTSNRKIYWTMMTIIKIMVKVIFCLMFCEDLI